jgi:hypothetical protein
MQMLDLYYKIWVDAIAATKAKKAEVASWKLYTLAPMSFLPGINLFTFFLWMKTLVNHRLPLFLPINIFDYRLVNDFISIVVTLFAPFIILNYLLIFSNERYRRLLKQYPAYKGKLYKKYALISLGLLVIPVLVVTLFFHEV